MTSRVSILIGQTRCPREQEGWKSRTLQLARQYESQVKKAATKQAMTKHAMAGSISAEQAVSFLLACAFPDRIARKRHSGGYQLANGRSATLPRGNQFTHDQWLAVAEVSGLSRSQGDVIRSGAVLDPELLEGPLQPLVQTKEVIEWSKKENRFVAEHRPVRGRYGVPHGHAVQDQCPWAGQLPDEHWVAAAGFSGLRGLGQLCPGQRVRQFTSLRGPARHQGASVQPTR